MGTLTEKQNERERAFLKSFCDIGHQGCWEWRGVKLDGWPAVISRKHTSNLAKDYTYELYYGSPPEQSEIYPACGNKKCINPAHLVLGTYIDIERFL